MTRVGPQRVAASGPEQSDEEFRLLVQNVRDYAILALDAGGHIISWNAGAEHIKGYRSDEILGRHFSVFYPAEDVADGKPEAELRIATAEGRLIDEGWRVRKDGSRFWAYVSITALYDDQHQVRGFGKVTRDMTERRATEQALAQARDAAVAATVAAEAATRAKSAFLATMSHEIRTPLNAVIGMTSLLLDTPLPDDHRRLVSIANDSGEALLAIVNDILDFSKIESGHLELEEAPFNFRACLDNALGQLRHVAERRGLNLMAQVQSSCPEVVVGDVTRFRQVVVNLLSNAVKFTTVGEVALTAECELNPDPDGYVAVSLQVRDTGSGIPEDRLDRLFQPFSQVDSSTTRLYGGTGLGLAISRRLARAMRGDLEVVTAFGEGSTFRFTAMLHASRDVHGAAAPADGTDQDTTLTDDTPSRVLHVLLAEDNVVNQRVGQLLLSRLGHDVQIVDHGAAALAAVHAKDYDVVLMDVQMPQMDGLEATRQIRAALPSSRQPYIVAMTANAFADDWAACADAGMDDYLAKPVRVKDLEATLLRVARRT